MDVGTVWITFETYVRSIISATGHVWTLIPAEWRAPAVLVASLGAVWGSLKFWRENRGLQLALRPGKYSGHIPADRFEIYPFDLVITNRASSPNSIVGVRFFMDKSERRCTVAFPVGLIGRPIDPYESLVAQVVVKADWLMSESFHEIRFRVEQGRGRTQTFRIKAEKLISTY